MPLYFFRQDQTSQSLRKQAHLQSGRVCQRLLLIANLLDGIEIDEATRLVGLQRGAAYQWHNRYEEEGISGLHDRVRSGKKCQVSDEIGREIYDRICAGAILERDGVVSFRGADVKKWLEDDYSINLQKSAVYNLIHRLKLSWLVPRPRHWKSDAEAQAEFLKLLHYNSRESRRTKLKVSESKCGSATKLVSVSKTQ